MEDKREYSFEVATVGELPQIVRMKISMFSESGHAHLLTENAYEVILSDYQSLYARSIARHYVAKYGTDIVGCAGAFLKEDLPFRYFKKSCYGFIGDVYTDPLCRGHGLASRLSEAALEWLRGQDVEMVRLLASEAGRQIYSNLGFSASDEMVFIVSTS